MKSVQSYLYFLITLLITSMLHIQYMASGLYWGESSLLTTRAWQLGGSHPSGYAAFLHLLHFFQKFFLLGDLPFRSNLLGIIFLSIAAGILTTFFLQLKISPLIAIPSSILFSIMPPVMNATVATEVYSLNLLLILLVLNILLKIYSDVRLIFLMIFFVGITITHHLTFVFFLPGLLFISLNLIIKMEKRLFVASIASCFLILGLSMLCYFPIREMQVPALVWGNARKLTGLFTLITAREESTGSLLTGLSNMNSIISRISIILRIIIDSITVPGLILVIPGICSMLKKSFDFLVLSFSSLIAISIAVVVYNSNETESFFLPGILLIWIFTIEGLSFLSTRFKNMKYKGFHLISPAFSYLPILGLLILIPFKTDRCAGETIIPRILSESRLNNITTDTLFISRRSDYCFLNWYHEQIEKRTTSNTIFQHLLSFNWYYNDLQLNDLINKGLKEEQFEDTHSWNSAVSAKIVFDNIKSRTILLADTEILQDLEMVGYSDYSLICLQYGAKLSADDYLVSNVFIPFYIQGNIDPLTTQVLSAEFNRQSNFFKICGSITSADNARQNADKLYNYGSERSWW